jgi:hypothetical protein
MFFNSFYAYFYMVRKVLYNYCYITIVIRYDFKGVIEMTHDQNIFQPLGAENNEVLDNLDPISSEIFQLFFLKNDEDRSVEVVETQTIPLNELIERLKHGESVFITYKSVQSNQNLVQRTIENLNEPWYFTHF